MNKILVIANSKGGTGKSTTALNLIEHLRPVKIVDADNHNGISLALKRGNYETPCVSVSNPSQLVDELDAEGIVLVDCGGFDSDVTRNAIYYADYLIIPSNDDLTELHGLGTFAKHLASVNSKRENPIKANVLLNRVHHARNDFSVIDQSIEPLGFKRLPVVIPFSSKIAGAAFTGESIKNGHLAAKYAQLSKIIKEQINE